MRIEKATQADVRDIVSLNKQFHLDGIPEFRWDKESWISSQIEDGNYLVLKVDPKTIYGAACVQLNSEYVKSMGHTDSDAYVEAIAIHKDKHNSGIILPFIRTIIDLAKSSEKGKVVGESFVAYEHDDLIRKAGFTIGENREWYGHQYFVFWASVSDLERKYRLRK